MAMRQYIGARYVPAYFENSATGDSTWAANTIYEALTIVTWNNNEYTSKKPVPASVGNPAENPTYWIATSNITGQISHLQDQLNDLADEVEDVQGDISDVEGDISTIQTNVSNLQTSVSNLNTGLGTANQDIATLQSDMNTASGNIATLTEDVGDIQDDIDDIQDDISDLQTAVAGLAGMEAVDYWINPDPTATFAAQTVYNANYAILTYKFLEVTFILINTESTLEYESMFVPIIDGYKFALNGTKQYMRTRDFTVSVNGVEFEGGRYWSSYGGDGASRNTLCVPVKIQLIK